MITARQLRAARALLGIDQRELARNARGLSLPTIQRMEASGVVRGNVDSLMKLVDALAADGIELIGEGAASAAADAECGSSERASRCAGIEGADGVYALYGVAALLALAPVAIALGALAARQPASSMAPA